jgi:hypothetical protein
MERAMLNANTPNNDTNGHNLVDWLEFIDSPAAKITQAPIVTKVVVEEPIVSVVEETAPTPVVLPPIKEKKKQTPYRRMSARVAFLLGEEVRSFICPIGDDPAPLVVTKLVALRFALVTALLAYEEGSKERGVVQKALNMLQEQYKESFGTELPKEKRAPRYIINAVVNRLIEADLEKSEVLDLVAAVLLKQYASQPKVETAAVAPTQKEKTVAAPQKDAPIAMVKDILTRHIGAEAAQVLVKEDSGEGDLVDVCSTIRWMVVASAQKLANNKDCTKWMQGEDGKVHSACVTEINIVMVETFGIKDLRSHRVDFDIRDALVDRLREVEGNAFLKTILPPVKQQRVSYAVTYLASVPPKQNDQVVDKKAEQKRIKAEAAEVARQQKLEDDRKTLETERNSIMGNLIEVGCTGAEVDRIMDKVRAGRSLDDIANGYVHANLLDLAQKVFSTMYSNAEERVKAAKKKLEDDRLSKLKIDSKDYGADDKQAPKNNGKKKGGDKKPKAVSQKVAGSRASAKAKKGGR